MKRFLLLMSVCFVVFGQVWAQSQTVNGTVLYASSDEPVIGASVLVQGSSEGTITDVNGKFSLRVKKGAILSVSFIGMITEQVAAADGMVVRLREDTEEIDEVMVVAFGTTTRKSFTGSASVVKSEEISKRQTSNITNSLAGQVAGVQGLSSNGQPGEVSSIRIRGLGSMSASNKPLYVVDGVAADDDVVATLANSDIASVTVLKDAASNALYGARGANGVVLITTKRGSTKDAQVSIDAKWGVNQRGVPTYDVMTDPGQYYSTFYTALVNQYGGDTEKAYKNLFNAKQGGLGYQVYTTPDGQRLLSADGSINPAAKLGYVNNYNGAAYTLMPDNWYKELFRSNNLRQEYNVNISGSSEKLTYYASASYLDDTGLIENSDFKRVTTRINVDYQAKKWLKVGTNMSYSHADQRYPDMENGNPSSVNLFYVSNFMAPIYPLYIRDGQGNIMTDENGYKMYDFGDAKVNGATRPFMSQSNPASNIELNKELFKKDILTGKWYVQIEPVKGLKATANVGVHYAGIRYQFLQNPFYGQYAEQGGYAYVNTSRYMAIDQQYLLTYTKKFQSVHNIDILAGYENFRYLMSSQSGQKSMVYDPTVAEISNAVLSPSASSASDSYFTQGILAQVKYDYDTRYFVSASYRRDASSRFASGHQWGNFWSVGAAWDINAESFMSEVDNIDLLKLKVSYGSQGNDNLGNYHVWTDQYDLTEQNGLPAVTLIYKGNEDLTWETSYNFNAGVDFGFFGDRLTGTVEGWRRRTTDMLYFRPVSPSLGYSSIPVNVGSVSNAGLDVELRGEPVKTKNFTWSVYVNASYFKNKILKLSPELNGQLIDGSWIYREGESMYNFYIREYAGVDANGKAQWYIDQTDAEGNVTRGLTTNWTAATQYETGDILPKVYGGFGTAFNFFGVDISAACSYQLGGKIYDSGYAELMHTGSSDDAGKNWHVDILNAWTPTNTGSNIPLINAAEEYENARSTRFLTSSNYLSLQNITVGYTLPKKITEKIKMEKLRVYFVADNVALLSARRGLDPRQSFSSSSQDSYSPIRSLSAGINITF